MRTILMGISEICASYEMHSWLTPAQTHLRRQNAQDMRTIFSLPSLLKLLHNFLGYSINWTQNTKNEGNDIEILCNQQNQGFLQLNEMARKMA